MYLAEPTPRRAPVSTRPAPSFASVLRPVSDVTAAPYRCICRVVANTRKGHSIGTAVLIGPWHALTAAHVIYPLQEPYQTTSISVSPGYHTSSSPTFNSNGWAVSPGWNARDCKTDGFDFGVIRLAKPVPSSIGYWAPSSFDPTLLPGLACNVAGYPASTQDPEAKQMFQSSGTLKGSLSITRCSRIIRGSAIQATAEGTLVRVTPTSQLIAHDAASEGSMSGGPVWLEGRTRSLVALHAGTIANGQFKKAVLLTPGAQASIRDLVNKLPPLARN
jgi:V8-like Glu-specific endopeptidase